MALIPPISPAIPTPILGQPQGFAADKAESDTKRVTGAAEGSNSGRSRSSTSNDGDARERSERSGQFSNTGTQGTRGGDSGMLSESHQLKSDGSREGRQDRAAERIERNDARQAKESVRQAEQTRTPREQSFKERMTDLVSRSSNVVSKAEVRTPASDKAKTEMFVERLTEVRKASAEVKAPAVEAPVVEADSTRAAPPVTKSEPVTIDAMPDEAKTAAQPASTGRYDKYV